MKSYHLTQEQASEIAKQTLTLPTYTNALKGELQAFANAVLDQVLGEPVGEFIEASDEESFGTVAWLLCNSEPLKTGDKLYAPIEQGKRIINEGKVT